VFLYRQAEVLQPVANVVRCFFLSDRSRPARPDLLGERFYVCEEEILFEPFPCARLKLSSTPQPNYGFLLH